MTPLESALRAIAEGRPLTPEEMRAWLDREPPKGAHRIVPCDECGGHCSRCGLSPHACACGTESEEPQPNFVGPDGSFLV